MNEINIWMNVDLLLKLQFMKLKQITPPPKKEKPKSGSIKIDSAVYLDVLDYCEKNGIKITFFATEAMKDKLRSLKS